MVIDMAMQGEALRALRKAAKMTQAELAEAIGMTATSIGLMERGAAVIEKRTELAVRYATRPERPVVERLAVRASDIEWAETDKVWSARIASFHAYLHPQTRDRWKVMVRSDDGYSPEWPRWEVGLENAKAAALLNVQHGLIDLAEAA